MKPFLLATFLLLLSGSALPYKSPHYCSLQAKDGPLHCICSLLHPKQKDGDPLPTCCRVMEKNAKAKACGCMGHLKTGLGQTVVQAADAANQGN